MTFGYEIDFNSLDAKAVKGTLDVVYTAIFVVLAGLLLRVTTGKSPSWFPVLEQMLGVGFVATSLAMVFVLPLTWEAVKIYLVYYFFQVFLYYALPGTDQEGLPVAEEGGKKRLYKSNGLLAFIVTVLLFFYGGLFGKWWNLTVIYDNFPAILNVVNVWSIVLAVAMYVKGKVAPTVLAHSTDNAAYDIWEGTELNPEIFGFDIKFFSESRPGLIGWVLVDISLAAYQFSVNGGLSHPIMLICGFHFIYVLDYFIHEHYIVSTWDITQERFGFMLIWGCYTWVPFFYTLPTWLLLDNTEISDGYASLCFVVFVVGFLVFRGANRQKHHFKTWIKNGQPEGEWMGGGFFLNAEPKVLMCRTRSKGSLLISGWWGAARHMNYTGDLIIALAFALPCQFRYGVLPYSHFIFMVGLLLHRFARDEDSCVQKYGRDWAEYCRLVPHRLIPGVF